MTILQFIFLVVLSLSVNNLLLSQVVYQHLFAVELDSIKQFSTDKLGNLYVLNGKDEVKKYDKTGQFLYEYNNSNYGSLDYIDVSNPFRPLFYYADYTVLVIVNRFFEIQQVQELADFDLFNVQTICSASNDNIWLYDNNELVIKQLNAEGIIINQTNPLSTYLDVLASPQKMLERTGLLYVNVPKKGILLFDNYGRYLKTIEWKHLNDFQVNGYYLMAYDGTAIKVLHLKRLTTTLIELPKENTNSPRQVRLEQSQLYVLVDNKIQVYSF